MFVYMPHSHESARKPLTDGTDIHTLISLFEVSRLYATRRARTASRFSNSSRALRTQVSWKRLSEALKPSGTAESSPQASEAPGPRICRQARGLDVAFSLLRVGATLWKTPASFLAGEATRRHLNHRLVDRITPSDTFQRFANLCPSFNQRLLATSNRRSLVQETF
jgi:hypothetical protein